MRAIVLDSVTWMRDPFPLSTISFSPGSRPLAMLFARNLDLLPGGACRLIGAAEELNRGLPTVANTRRVPLSTGSAGIAFCRRGGSIGDMHDSVPRASANKVLIKIKSDE